MSRISWQTCPPTSAAAQARFTCATVRVPLEYQDPAGPKIKLAVVRHAATGPARRGVIFMNPGGPGYRGTLLIPEFVGLIPSALLRDYDIVSWDPRGVGALLKHVSTADTARDMSLLRRDLGQSKLNCIGVSYGTYVGATYANLFPRQVGKMVLDGNVAPTSWTNGGQLNASRSFLMRLGSTTGVAKTLAAFRRICGQGSSQECAFTAGTPAQTTAKWDALLARLRQGPLTLGTNATIRSRPLHRLRQRPSRTPGPSRTLRSRAATPLPLQPMRSPAFSASYSGKGA